jgi:crotonobetainyl-CoA:carnitine CoA-transferase CaiB-like acyl-CoA transferase
MEVSRPAPLLGQHNDEVLSELFGYSREKIDDLRAGKVII